LTTIAYRNGVLAADSMAYGGKYCASPGLKWKIGRLENGDRLGVSSNVVGAGEAMRDWLNGRLERTLVPPDVRAILVNADGQVFIANDGVLFSGPIDTEFCAIGSGADFALGAMQHGADAVEAVRCAIAHDQHTGGEVRVLLDEPVKVERAA
jgi:ATP-dependent protease HslVU (ClpYQ) peptidase subunit